MTPTPEDSVTEAVDSPDDDFTESFGAGSGSNAKRWMTFGLVPLIIVVLLVGAMVGGVGPFAKTPTTWSAVFLTDNEVFFGHVKHISADDIDLVNVYYVQSSQGTQTGSTQSSTQLAVLGLVGTQIQCPQDELIVNRHSVLDVQELQSSSFVVSRLETLSKKAQTCFQPVAATPTAAAPGAPAATAAPTPSP